MADDGMCIGEWHNLIVYPVHQQNGAINLAYAIQGRNCRKAMPDYPLHITIDDANQNVG
jgi:hypothetical protein